MSPHARLMCGIGLILTPAIVYGGLTVLGVVLNGAMGIPAPRGLSPSRIAFYRAGHAHAGVLALLAWFLEVVMDYAAVPRAMIWPVRVGAIAAAILVSGGFLAIAHARALRWLLYLGAALVIATTLIAGTGLIRASW